MTWTEVRGTGADIVRSAFPKIPIEDWTELTLEDLRRLHASISADLEGLKRGTSATAFQEANMQKLDANEALKRAEAGARVFTVEWDGTRAFAATKVAE